MILPTEGETLVLDVYETKMTVQDLMAMTRESHQIITTAQETLGQQEERRFIQLRDRMADMDQRLQRMEERLRAMETRMLQGNYPAAAGAATPSRPQTQPLAQPATDMAPPPASVVTTSAEELYGAAVGLFEKEMYDDAVYLFEEILSKHPQSDHAEAAQYGLAEAYEYMGDYARAAEEYMAIPARYPSGEQSAQARYKAAMCHVQLGDRVRARELLQEILIKHPSIHGHPRVREALEALTPQY